MLTDSPLTLKLKRESDVISFRNPHAGSFGSNVDHILKKGTHDHMLSS